MSRFTRCDFLKLASAGAAAAAGGGLLWRWLANQNGAEVPTTASGGDARVGPPPRSLHFPRGIRMWKLP